MNNVITLGDITKSVQSTLKNAPRRKDSGESEFVRAYEAFNNVQLVQTEDGYEVKQTRKVQKVDGMSRTGYIKHLAETGKSKEEIQEVILEKFDIDGSDEEAIAKLQKTIGTQFYQVPAEQRFVYAKKEKEAGVPETEESTEEESK